MKKLRFFIVISMLFGIIYYLNRTESVTIIRLVVPYPAGTGLDTIARSVGDGLEKQFHQPVIVVNKVGSSPYLGAKYVEDFKADGDTIFFATKNFIPSSIAVDKPINYILTKFTPVALTTYSPVFLVVRSGTYEDLLKRKRPLIAGVTNNGGAIHFATYDFSKKANLESDFVFYKDSVSQLKDIESGDLDYGLIPIQQIMQHLNSNSIKVLATTSKDRLAILPDVPTFDELGIKNFTTDFWEGAFVLSETPQDKIEKLRKVIELVKTDPEFVQRLRAVNTSIMPNMSTDGYKKIIENDITYYDGLSRKLNIK
jgi:tripartite-type tricarboxylate transporter receptor subunit TctC